MSTPNDRHSTLVTRHSSLRKSRGLSLVELIVFIVIVGASVAGIIGVITVTTRASADPVIRKQALAIAEAVLEEVQLQPFTYCDPDDPGAATANAAGAPIAFLAAAQAGIVGPTMTLTINKPAGTVQNNVMIASIGFRVNSPGQYSTDIAVAAPAGWTLVRRLDNLNSTGSGLAIYQWVAGASEPASYAWTFSCINASGGNTCNVLGFNGAAGGILSFSGVDTTTPIDVENGAPSGNTPTQLTPSINTTVANTMLVTSHAIANDNNFQNPPPSGMTQAFQRTSATEMIQVSYALQATVGATGTKSATDLQNVSTADYGNAHILALKPGSSCGTLMEAIGPETAGGTETRYSTTLPFDNVNDYHGFDSNVAQSGLTGIRNIDGTLIAGLEGYRVTVSVAGQALGAIGNDASGSPQSLLITVTVTGPGNTTVTLNGYRTRYAPNLLP